MIAENTAMTVGIRPATATSWRRPVALSEFQDQSEASAMKQPTRAMELQRKAMGCQMPNLCLLRSKRAVRPLTAGSQSTLMPGHDREVLRILKAPGAVLEDAELNNEIWYL